MKVDVRCFKKNGYIVVRNVIDKETCDNLLFWMMNDPLSEHAHSSFMWHLRRRKEIGDVFRILWKRKKMCVSFGGCGTSSRHFELPLHTDQCRQRRRGLQSIQGLLSLAEMNEETGGTLVVPGSHKIFEDACAARNDPHQKWEYMEWSEDHLKKYEFQKVRPHLHAGDMLLWDSRTIHAVVKGMPGGWMTRTVCYLSMLPRSHISESTIRRRRRAYTKGQQTTHWIDRVVTTGDELRPPWEWKDAPRDVKQLVGCPLKANV